VLPPDAVAEGDTVITVRASSPGLVPAQVDIPVSANADLHHPLAVARRHQPLKI
jgi:hypothetical protein